MLFRRKNIGVIVMLEFRLKVNEKLDTIVQKQIEKEKVEYKKLIEENNKNNNQ